MPRCPKCRYRFATLEDETDMHACPRCGYGEPEPPRYEVVDADEIHFCDRCSHSYVTNCACSEREER